MPRRVAMSVVLAVGAIALSSCASGDVLSGRGSAVPGAESSGPSGQASSVPAPSSGPATSAPVAAPSDAPTSATPAPGDTFVGATCAQFTPLVVKSQNKPGPVPAVTAKRESIGSLLEETRGTKNGFPAKLETSGTFVSPIGSKNQPAGYQCYSGVPDVGLKLSFGELSYFYTDTDTRAEGGTEQAYQHLYEFTLKVKLRASAYKAPAVIFVSVFGGLSRDVIDKSEAEGNRLPLRGSVLIFWTLNV